MTKTVVILAGPPASGKTTLAKQLVEQDPTHRIAISKDDIRLKYLKDEDDYWAYEEQVFRDWIAELIYAIQTYDIVYADASHLTKDSRLRLMGILQNAVYDIKLDFELAFSSCLDYDFLVELNSRRTGRRKVGMETVIALAAIYELPDLEEIKLYKEIYNFSYQEQKGK